MKREGKRGRVRVAFQGEPGSFSHLAVGEAMPRAEAVACETFDAAFTALSSGRADFALIPIENSVHGRIADIHHVLPGAHVHFVGEHFLRVHHQLMAAHGAKLAGIRTVISQEPALGQCRKIVKKLKLKTQAWSDTAAAARHVAALNDPTVAAVASELAAKIHGLTILKRNVEDASHNVTRFILMAREPARVPNDGRPVITSFIFRVKNVPAALYKATGGFATNGVNMTKLESYQLEGSFAATQFYADIEGHPESRPVKLAFEELAFFTSTLKVLGTYRAHPFRKTLQS